MNQECQYQQGERFAELNLDKQSEAQLIERGLNGDARALDAQGTGGLLHGLPIAVKDLFDTFDMPTSYGSPIYADHRPAWDAACVAVARASGAIVVGKSVTTEFATFQCLLTRIVSFSSGVAPWSVKSLPLAFEPTTTSLFCQRLSNPFVSPVERRLSCASNFSIGSRVKRGSFGSRFQST